VTSDTLFGRVFKDAAYVALFALQCGMHISQQEPCSGVIERRGYCRLGLNEWGKTEQYESDYCCIYFCFAV
jgi:hypothetical protein